jgi:hypothetical protein
MYELGVIVLCILLLLFAWYVTGPSGSRQEHFSAEEDLGLNDTSSIGHDGTDGMPAGYTGWAVTASINGHTDNSKPVNLVDERRERDPAKQSYVRLYSDYRGRELQYEYTPTSGFGYDRQILRIPVKHIEISVPSKTEGPYNQIRHVEIWNMYGGKPNASTISPFYNAYLEPGSEFTANRARYRLLARALPGDRISMDVTEPVGQIFLSAIL